MWGDFIEIIRNLVFYLAPKCISIPGESVINGLIIFLSLLKEKKMHFLNAFLNKDMLKLNHPLQKFVTIPEGVIFKKSSCMKLNCLYFVTF